MDKLYEQVYSWAKVQRMGKTIAALTFVKEELDDANGKVAMSNEYMIHGLSMAWMIIDLQLPISANDLDMILAASVCHVLAELFDNYDYESKLQAAGIDGSVIEFVKKIIKVDEEKSDANLKVDRLLFIVKLAERSNLMEHLCDMSIGEAKAFILETKRYLFPMCIYGKENYPEFDGQISLLKERMRCLIQVLDILFAKYDAEEDTLCDEILDFKEENSRIRMAIKNRWNVSQ